MEKGIVCPFKAATRVQIPLGTPVYPNDLREFQIALQKFWEQTGSYLEPSVSFSHLTFKDGTLEWWIGGEQVLM